MAAILLVIFSVMLIMLVAMSYKLRDFSSRANEEDEGREKKTMIIGWINAAMVLIIIALLVSLYFTIAGSVYESHLREWLNIIVRVMHITFGIAWIGASFYFVFLENALNRTEGVRDELAGNLWAVHGGGFYYLEKYKGAPKTMPKKLHWFKYEAYFTWISGVALLFVVYYFNASAMLTSDSVMKMPPATGISIGLGSLVLAWLAYDVLCKSPIRRNVYLFALAIFTMLGLFAFGYSQVFVPRAAYIHFGALIGTLMAGNVFFIIIPSQKAMVNAASKGIMPDVMKGKNALFRSIHNNYFTLPVLFVMVSNHFPG
ncbi:MAG TPA: urate hydroxylase PuuD, partial [Chitinophagaceae bacterium]|nr:urate hydroxylase PuuD [Chitinophagaceae bacterium]